jgi:DNA-binding CsgD family transcriptional regulator
LRGRAVECAKVDELLAAVREGHSGVLVMRGDAGVGKTALLDFAAAGAAGTRVLRACGVESELELPYATLHQLCLPLLDGVGQLPEPQRDALGMALGLSGGPTPDRFLVGLAVLTLLSNAAEAEPIVVLVDDAQWLDRSSGQVLSFVARRLRAESVAILFAARDEGAVDELDGLPELPLGLLSDMDAREVLESAGIGLLDERVRDRIIAEARGNPLALLELPRGLSPAGLAGGFAVPEGMPLAGRIEASFLSQVAQLREETQRLLLVSAADPLGDPALLWGAAGALGISVEAVAPAEEADLITVGARVTFRHPLLRSALYTAASPPQRRAAHRALAEATDSAHDPDGRAWHRAQAALAPDDDIAVELELSAGRAQARGGLAAAAAFLERAAELTTDTDRRAERRLAAARLKWLAGLPDAASTLLADAARGPLSDRDRAALQRLRGQIALDMSRDSEAARLLLDAAGRFELVDPARGRDTYLEALWAATRAGQLGDGVAEAARAARSAPAAAGTARPTDVLVDGLAIRFTEGYAAAAPILRELVSTAAAGGAEDDVLPSLMASRIAAELFDDDAWDRLVTRDIQDARAAGALSVLPTSLNFLAYLRTHECELAAAERLLDEADEITAATGNAQILNGRLLLAAYRGDVSTAETLGGEERRRLARERGEGLVLTLIDHVRAVLDNGLGRYETAFEAAQRSSTDDSMLSTWSLPELIEAAAYSDRSTVAADSIEMLAERTQAAGTTLARGLEARSRALVSDGRTAEDLYVESIDLLARTRMRLHRARAQLVYGEWLRRTNRRRDARRQLRAAHETFAVGGAEAFAKRASRELLATGETARKRTDETRGQLTAQEQQISRLAAEGMTNPEIGAQLFLSPRTVEWHLRNVYTKLGISSRRELWVARRETERPQPRV